MRIIKTKKPSKVFMKDWKWNKRKNQYTYTFKSVRMYGINIFKTIYLKLKCCYRVLVSNAPFIIYTNSKSKYWKDKYIKQWGIFVDYKK